MILRPALAIALLSLLAHAAHAQSIETPQGFVLREVSVSTGYAALQLPPVTLGGHLPGDVLDSDLITSTTADAGWRRVTPRTRSTLELFGTYSARARHTQLNAPGGNLSLGLSRVWGSRWEVGGRVTATANSVDQLLFQPTQARRLVEDAASLDDLAASVASPLSRAPDPIQAALFVPINQTLDDSDFSRTWIVASSVRADVIYAHSARLATYLRTGYTVVRRLWSGDATEARRSPDSNAESGGAGVRVDLSERSLATAGVDWSQVSGVTADRTVTATLGYGWSGRKWVVSTTLGAAFRPFPVVDSVPTVTPLDRTPEIVGSGTVGYKFRTQTFLFGYSRAAHNEFGQGGRNTTTGFTGTVQSVTGSWSRRAPRGRWTTEVDASFVRRPGNFSYIHTWLATARIGRPLTSRVHLVGELLFDRHGSRAFEGFFLTREGARVSLVWTPQRRQREEPLPEYRQTSGRCCP